MQDKNKLLSIGDIAKLTGATIKALRYYDRIKLLEPMYIDPTSKYRYYTFDQAYFVSIIMFCVELDIPLKELTKFIDENKTIDFSALLVYGKGIAEQKLKKLQQGLQFIDNVEQKIALSKEYQNQPIYSRDIPEKFFYVVPINTPFDEIDRFEVLLSFLDLEYSEEDEWELTEYGYLCEYSPTGVRRYAFAELLEYKESENIKVIPAGKYFCTQTRTSKIENTPKVFEEHLKGENSFLAIETEIFASKYEINKPINELRVIELY